MDKNESLKQKYFEQIQDIRVSVYKMLDTIPSKVKDYDDMLKQLKIVYAGFDLIYANINPASKFTVDALERAINALDNILSKSYNPVSDDNEEFIEYTMDFLEKVKFNAECMLDDMPNYVS